MGETSQAQTISTESLQIFQSINDGRGTAFVFSNLGLYSSQMGSEKEALEYYQESLMLRELNGDQWGLANVLIPMGAAALSLGDIEKAYQHLMRALRIAHHMQFLPILVSAMGELAFLFMQSGDIQRARQMVTLCLSHPSINRETSEKAKKRFKHILTNEFIPISNQEVQTEFEQEVKNLLEQEEDFLLRGSMHH